MHTMMFEENKIPYLTADTPGISGIIKKYNEDFIVTEIPLYEASGQGTHCYFTLEKHSMTTQQAIRLLAKHTGKKRNDFGYAGLKDAHGITQQRISIEHISPEDIRRIDIPGILINNITFHTNKLKLGHLAGNSFDLKIRNFKKENSQHGIESFRRIVQKGLPNYFGPQRFGLRKDNALIGHAVMQGKYDSAIQYMLGQPSDNDNEDVKQAREFFDDKKFEQAAARWPSKLSENTRLVRTYIDSGNNAKKTWKAVHHDLRRLLVSSVQSLLFNQLLTERINMIDQLVQGDVAWKHQNGACFQVDDPQAEQARCDSFEISPSGPLFGRKMKTPTGHAAEIEQKVLTRAGFKTSDFKSHDGTSIMGARRPLRVPVKNAECQTGKDHHGDFFQCRFTLPPGSYATSLTREICKTNQ